MKPILLGVLALRFHVGVKEYRHKLKNALHPANIVICLQSIARKGD